MKRKLQFILIALFISTTTLTFGQIYFEDGFEAGNIDTWSNVDNDGDANLWATSTAGPHSGAVCATSASWASAALTPDNYLVTPAIDLEDATGNITLEYWVRAQDQTWPNEHYSCLISTVDGSVAELTTVLLEETLTTGPADEEFYFKRSIDLSAYAGELVWIAWRHYDCTDWFRLNLDDVVVFSNASVDAGVTAITAPSNDGGCALTATEEVTVTIFNYGGADITGFPVSYSIDGGAPVTETFTGTIGASASMDYTFATTADLSTLGYYTINGSVALTDDSDATNDSVEAAVSSGDASITVEAMTDSAGGQAWTITNTNGDVVASHGAYQWDITETTTVCVIDNDCYTFNWISGNVNTVTVSYNGVQINQTVTAGEAYEVFPMGSNCADNDVELTAVTTPGTAVAGDVLISGTVKNIGAMALTSFDVTYSVNGGAESAVYSVVGANIASSATFDFTHDVPYTFGSGVNEVTVTVSNPNGVTDESPANNVGMSSLTVVNEAFQQVVVGEEATGTWCQWCPRGTVALTDLAHNVTDGSWIGIAVHNGDPMADAEYDAGIGQYIGGYPSGAINRLPGVEVDPGNFAQAHSILASNIPLGKVDINTALMQSDTREVTVDGNSVFALDMLNQDNRISVIVIENGLMGTTADWSQVNAYSGLTPALIDWTGFDWSTAGNPVAGLTYNHVGREIIGGFTGIAGSVPADVVYNESNAYEVNFTLSNDYNADNVEIVVLLLNAADGSIINAATADLDIMISNENIGNANDVKVYPNPTTGNLTIDANKDAVVNIYNIVGKLVMTSTMNSSVETININELSNGTYIVKINDNNTIYSKKVVLTK